MNELRNREMVRMHVEDRMPLRAIGRVYGISGERVRQLVRREGVPQPVTADVAALARRCQRVPRLDRTCQECEGAFKVLPSQAARPFCSTQCYIDSIGYSRDELIDHLQGLAALLSRTPNQSDINSADGPYHTVYVKRFGSIRTAQECAGLKPNERGGAGHVRIAPKAESDARAAVAKVTGP